MSVLSNNPETINQIKLKVTRQSSQVRCYLCGDPKINAICHHCGRAMCIIHTLQSTTKKTPTSPKVRPNFVQRLFRHFIKFGAWTFSQLSRFNQEYTGLGLAQTPMREIGVHCHYCVHYDWPYFTYFFIALAVFLAMIVIATNFWSNFNILGLVLSLFLGVVSLSISILCFTLNQKQESTNYTKRPPIPLLGKVTYIDISEFLKGKVSLSNNGQYYESSLSRREKGVVEVTVQFTLEDREILQAYRDKYRLNYTHMIPFSTGFLATKGAVDLHFNKPTIILKMMNVVKLVGYIRDQPFFTELKAGHYSYWKLTYPYTYSLTNEERGEFPIQIVPAVVNEGEEWGIELTVQTRSKQNAENAVIKNFTLYSASILGRAIRTRPGGIYQSGVIDNKTIVNKTHWEDIFLDEGNEDTQYKTFYVRFENSVNSSSSFSGRLQITLNGTFSNLQGISLFYPSGIQRKGLITTKKQTNISLDFEFSINTLRFTHPKSLSKSITREGIIPDHKIVTSITDAISENHIYVQRIIENPPRTNRADASITNRFWDIAGRSYRGVFPVDFHLVLTGQEWYEGADQPARGVTKVDITVQSMTTDDDTTGYIQNVCERISSIIEDKLKVA